MVALASLTPQRSSLRTASSPTNAARKGVKEDQVLWDLFCSPPTAKPGERSRTRVTSENAHFLGRD